MDTILCPDTPSDNLFRITATLDLKINAFAGLIQPQIGQLASTLTLLDLSANMFTGTLPTEIGNLVALTDLRIAKSDTSTNPDGSCPSGCLNGTLPTELGRLVNLKILWLFENSFTGMLPSEFGKLQKLTECLLYSNSIEGEIPKAFSNLKNLGEFLKYRFPNRVKIDVLKFVGLIDFTHKQQSSTCQSITSDQRCRRNCSRRRIYGCCLSEPMFLTTISHR
jgi:hypothetical protein